MNAEILTYSRARGVFVGTNLNGASLTQDDDDTKALYGDTLSFSDILQGKTRNPEATQPFLTAVEDYAGRANEQH